MIENYYEIDKQGNIIGRFKINSLTDTPRPWWVKGNIDGMHEPRYINGEWIDAKSDSELLEDFKKAKIDELSRECQKRIIEGFSINGEHYSYNQDNQINFQDTYQLFLNNMIDEIGWNVYVDGEKTRKILNKEKFQKVYLAGVKHKVDTMNRLNDVLIPMVNSTQRKEVVARIYWDEGLDSESLELDIGNTIGTKIEKVEKVTKEVQDSSLTTMMALLQVSSLVK